MTKKYAAYIIAMDPDVEELILLEVNGMVVRCFASYCPLAIEVGQTYEVEFEMMLPEELRVSKTENKEVRVDMLGSGFSCEIYGFLAGDIFQSFVELSDHGIHFDYPHLNEQYVKITAERIDALFCP